MKINAMKATLKKEILDANPNLERWLKATGIEILIVERAELEKTGVHAFCAFADLDKHVVLIKEDMDTLSDESVIVIIYHEIAHIVYPEWDEDHCNEFAKLHTSCEAYELARKESDAVRAALLQSKGVFTFDGSDAMWEAIKQMEIGHEIDVPDDEDDVKTVLVYKNNKGVCLFETRVNGEPKYMELYNTTYRTSEQIW